MKKASAVSNRLHQRRERRRLKRSASKRHEASRRQLPVRRVHSFTTVQYSPEYRRYYEVLKCPEKLNLAADYDSTIAFLGDVRYHSNRRYVRLQVDLTSLQEISPAAALLVVAEFDRWRSRTKANRLTPASLEDWNPTVRRRLKEMGFFEALGATCHIEDIPDEQEDRYVRFITGRGSDGEAIRRLRQGIEGLGPNLVDRAALYDGVVEAMTNVHQHAYPKGHRVRRWWVSASVNVARNRLRVMVADHGAGITATIRRKGFGEEVRRLFGGSDLFRELLEDDARLLEAAFADDESSNRSQTGLNYRGKGLRQDIKGYISENDSNGRLRVFSNHGKYVYQRERGVGVRAFGEYVERPFRGTFIEWTIEGYGDV
ncbi:ATP-binding protein [Thermomonas fusca]